MSLEADTSLHHLCDMVGVSYACPRSCVRRPTRNIDFCQTGWLMRTEIGYKPASKKDVEHG